jgi:hypothetical protein
VYFLYTKIRVKEKTSINKNAVPSEKRITVPVLLKRRNSLFYSEEN